MFSLHARSILTQYASHILLVAAILLALLGATLASETANSSHPANKEISTVAATPSWQCGGIIAPC